MTTVPTVPTVPDREFFLSYLSSWESNDVDTVMAFFTEDAVFLDTTLNHGATGERQLRKFIQAAFTTMAGTRLEYVNHVATDEGYMVEWVLHPAKVVGVSVGSLRDGKISSNRDYWNGAAFQIPNA